jgi:uncharacterized membrane protein (DUF106 family)|tara:strand:+ start:124 stop:303 length:180 start_codon:yes stop_codon:yes gene_type:complete
MGKMQRLKQDVKALDHYIHKVKRKGDPDLAHKIMKKRDFLQQHINEVEHTDRVEQSNCI